MPKTRADLLVRDALAAAFVRASHGESAARTLLDRLSAWAEGPAPEPRQAAHSAPPRAHEAGGTARPPDATALEPEHPERQVQPCDKPRAAGLGELRTEHGEAIFDSRGQLCPTFTALEPYVRDRARRFRAAIGWLCESGSFDDELERARAAWDAGLFFEVHELLEPPWLEARGPRKTALQGLILAGAALHHLTQNNLAGAGSLLCDAERRLDESPRLGGVELLDFGRELGELGRRIRRGEVRHWADLDDVPHF